MLRQQSMNTCGLPASPSSSLPISIKHPYRILGEYQLCAMENSPGTYKIIQMSLLYRNSTGRDKVDIYHRSFSRLLELYPIVIGHRTATDNGNAITVDKEDLEIERFYVHTENQTTVDDFNKIRYCRDQWPLAVDTAFKERVNNVDRLITADVICLSDGYLIALSVSHIITDGAGCFILLEQWASLSKALSESLNPVSENIMPTRSVFFDHEIFWSQLKKYPADRHPYVEHIMQEKTFDNTKNMREQFTRMCQTGAISETQDPLRSHVLHLSSKSIAQLSQEYASNSESEIERPLHGIQIFYALLWQRLITAIRAAQDPLPTYADDYPVFLNILHNIRSMVPTASYYVGNAVTGVYAPASVKDLVEKPIIDMARHIKSHVNRVTPGAAVHLTEESFSPNSDFVLRVLSTNNRPGAFIVISNVSRLPFYSLDFGLGTPKAVLCGTKPTEGMMFWMPHGSEDNEDDDGGVDIYCGLLDSVFLLLKKDNILGKFAKFLC